jgi:MFS family permease
MGVDNPLLVNTPPRDDAWVETKPTVMAWFGLGVLVLLAFVSFLDRQVIALMVGPIEHALHITDTHIGLLQGAAFGLVSPFFAIPLGYAADRYSRRWVIFWGVTFWAVAAMLSGLAHSFDTLMAARVGVGIGEAAVGPAAASLLSDMFPKRRLATVFSIYGSGTILGSAGALAISGAVMAWAGGGVNAPILGHLDAWQIAFIVTGAPAAVLALLVFLVPEPPRARKQADGKAVVQVRWAEVWAFVRENGAYLTVYIAGQSCLLIVTWAGLAWLPVIMERTYALTSVEVGSMLGAFIVLLGFPGQLFNGAVVDRMFVRHDDAHLRYYAFAAIIVTISGILGPFAPSALLYLVITAPVKALLNFAGVFSAALQIVTPARLRGRVTALAGVVTGVVGSTFGPSIVAFFTDAVFHDKAKVIWSLALTTAIFIPLAGIIFACGLKPMREAVRRERARG